MSLITQCPACSTMFKVVPDQLRISDGWVRCGQCDEVFDANANLHSELAPVSVSLDAEPLPREPVATTSPDPDWAASLRFASDETPQAADGATVQELQAQVPSDAAFGNEKARVESLLMETRGVAQSERGLDDFLSQSPKALAQAPGVDHETPPLGAPVEPLMETLPGPAPRYTQAYAKGVENEEIQQPSFMRQSRGSSVWHKTGVRFILGVTGLFLFGALVAQVAIQERDRWAAYEPSMVPALQALCDVMGCSLSPLRSIEAVVIDSSSFTKVRTDVYRLNVALKNNGPVPVAPPALELTLTDMQDQGLMRRVLKPQDFGFKANTLEPGVEFSAALPIAVKAGNPSERVSGYRLLAFYP